LANIWQRKAKDCSVLMTGNVKRKSLDSLIKFIVRLSNPLIFCFRLYSTLLIAVRGCGVCSLINIDFVEAQERIEVRGPSYHHH